MPKHKRRRENPAKRRAEILHHALDLAEEIGYSRLTRDAIAKRAGVAFSLVTYYFRNIENLKIEMILEAIDLKIIPVLAEALTMGELTYNKLPRGVGKKVIEYLTD